MMFFSSTGSGLWISEVPVFFWVDSVFLSEFTKFLMEISGFSEFF